MPRDGTRLVCSQCVEEEEADGGRRVRGSRKQILRSKQVLSPQRWAPSKAHLLDAVIMPELLACQACVPLLLIPLVTYRDVSGHNTAQFKTRICFQVLMHRTELY